VNTMKHQVQRTVGSFLHYNNKHHNCHTYSLSVYWHTGMLKNRDHYINSLFFLLAEPGVSSYSPLNRQNMYECPFIVIMKEWTHSTFNLKDSKNDFVVLCV
jgi:hypothetical protein